MPARTAEYMEDRRAHIVSATMACIRRLGLAATSLTDICTEAGISRGALYVHFGSRDEILAGVVGRLEEESSAAFVFDNAQALRKSLHAQLRRLTQAKASPMATLEMELLVESRSNEALQAALARGVATRYRGFEAGLAQLAEAGQLRPGVQVREAAHAVLSFLTGLIFNAQASRLPAALHAAALELVLAPILGD
jgi:AcrR family transcriptional regulator